MVMAERHKRIIELLSSSGIVLVEDLAAELQVSTMTIRRDLNKLKKQGHLHRCYGGAVITTSVQGEETYDNKMASRADEKKRIAVKCANLVNDGDTVFLDSGTTTYQIANKISSKRDLTIITNDIKIACRLLESKAKIIVCGGKVQNINGSVLGLFGREMLEQMRTDISFIGAACINEDYNLMTPTIESRFLKRSAINVANRNYLVVDNSKFYRQSLVEIVNMTDFTAVITDKDFSSTEQKKIRDMGINIIQA